MSRMSIRSPAFATLICAIAATALFASTAAHAQNDYDRNGFYLGLGGTFAIYTNAEDEAEKGLAALGYVLSVDVDDPLGVNARLGYRVDPRIAVEGEFEWLSEADVSVMGISGVTLGSTQILAANAKGYVLTGRVQPFGLVGVGVMWTKLSAPGVGSEKSAGFAARFGGGVDFYITSNIVGSLDVSYVLPTGGVEDFDYVSIGWGFGYRF